MRRRARIPFGICIVAAGLAAAVAGCGRQETGAHVYVRLGQLEYDELQLRVTLPATGDTVVDPATDGRYVGPFRPGDQDTIIYLSDALDGSALHLEATALRTGMTIGAGAADMLVARGTIKVVEIVMGPPGATTPSTANSSTSPAPPSCW